MGADALRERNLPSTPQNASFLPHQFPYPPWCPVFGWLVAKGGWVRLAADVMVTLGHAADHQTRRLAAEYGVRVRQCNWRGRVIDCLHYRDAVRMVCGSDPARCRSP